MRSECLLQCPADVYRRDGSTCSNKVSVSFAVAFFLQFENANIDIKLMNLLLYVVLKVF